MKTKLLESVKAVNTGQKKYIDSHLSRVEATYEPVDLAFLTPDVGYVYRFGVELGVSQTISDHELQGNPDILDMYRDRVCRGIAEELYGEVRKEIIEILIALQRDGLPHNHTAVNRLETLLEKISY